MQMAIELVRLPGWKALLTLSREADLSICPPPVEMGVVEARRLQLRHARQRLGALGGMLDERF